MPSYAREDIDTLLYGGQNAGCAVRHTRPLPDRVRRSRCEAPHTPPDPVPPTHLPSRRLRLGHRSSLPLRRQLQVQRRQRRTRGLRGCLCWRRRRHQHALGCKVRPHQRHVHCLMEPEVGARPSATRGQSSAPRWRGGARRERPTRAHRPRQHAARGQHPATRNPSAGAARPAPPLEAPRRGHPARPRRRRWLRAAVALGGACSRGAGQRTPPAVWCLTAGLSSSEFTS